MRDHVCLCEFAGGTKAIAQLVEKSKIEIYLFVAGTIKRSGGSSGLPAWRIRLVAKQNELRVTVIGNQFIPVGLRVVEHERNKLHFLGFRSVARGIHWSADARRCRAGGTGVEERRDQIPL